MVNHSVCPDGYVRRRGYTRKYRTNIQESGFTVRRKGKVYTVHPKGHSIKVSSSCVKERTRKNARIGKLRKGDLIKYGYQYRLSDHLRHNALNKAIKSYGALSVYRKLDAVVKLSVRTAPDAHAIFLKDRKWVHAILKRK
jgi:hypothetical protein